MPKSELRIDYLPIDGIKRAPRNPKEHDLGAIHQAIARFGYVMPVLLNERTGRLVAGHGRLDALLQLQKDGKAPPENIRVKDGKWLVPVIRGKSFRNEAEAEAYLVADNRLTTLGDWNQHTLAELLVDLAKGSGLAGTGYDKDDLDELLKDLKKQEGGEDTVPTPPKTPVTKPGWIYELGDQRLICGDSTDATVVERLMGDQRAALMATDPPYGIGYEGGKDGEGVRPKGKGKAGGWSDIDNDITDGPKLQAFLEACFRAATARALRPNAAWFLWHAHLTQGFFAAAAAADLLLNRQIIWVKPVLMFGRGHYHWKHELCFYGWVKGNRPPFYGKHNQTTVWEITNETTPANRKHPTQKPLELFIIPIRNHTKPGEVLYEPFAGSGTQVIAAEKTGRRCHAIEISPAYCDVIVERWEKFSGRKARLHKPV